MSDASSLHHRTIILVGIKSQLNLVAQLPQAGSRALYQLRAHSASGKESALQSSARNYAFPVGCEGLVQTGLAVLWKSSSS